MVPRLLDFMQDMHAQAERLRASGDYAAAFTYDHAADLADNFLKGKNAHEIPAAWRRVAEVCRSNSEFTPLHEEERSTYAEIADSIEGFFKNE